MEAIERVEGLVSSGEVTPHTLGQGRTGVSVPHDEYQRVIEHLAALDAFLQVLHQTASLPADGNAWGLSAEELEALGYPEGMPSSLGMIDFWETSTIDQLAWGQVMVPELFFGVKQQALLNHYSLEFEKMDRVRRALQSWAEIDPDEDLEALVPTARMIQAILAPRAPCDWIATSAKWLVEAMEAIRSLAPRPRTN